MRLKANSAAMSARELPQKLAVVGLGYVGLPLAMAFSRHLPTIGFDLDARRVQKLDEEALQNL